MIETIRGPRNQNEAQVTAEQSSPVEFVVQPTVQPEPKDPATGARIGSHEETQSDTSISKADYGLTWD